MGVALWANALAGDGGQSERVSDCLRRGGGVDGGVRWQQLHLMVV